ncbi:hypothetical protein ABIE61_003684 [Marinobacterium sp. MBR-111]|jgi:hypothetical protein|uniref:hypothetical protein n=1 Tax=Marinobacterium sp. MBR-111 TaxID=3156463 RepID=UPI003398AB63
MFKKVVLVVFLIAIAPAYAMPGYDMSYGQWKRMCGQPGPACDLFLSGFLYSANFWKQWLSGAAALRPDLKNAGNVVGYLGVYANNGEVCLPESVQFESVRQKVNSALLELGRSEGGLHDSQVINHEAYRIDLYEAFKRAYPCHQ